MAAAQPATDEHTAELTVSELVHATRDCIRQRWPDKVWVTGETSGVRQYPSGHVYLTIKDKGSEASAIIYRNVAYGLDEIPPDGQEVKVLVEPTMYAAKGRFQLVIHAVNLAGTGRLHQEFLKLKERLRGEGWFDQERKRKLPSFPRLVGVVVSTEGAAWRDVQKTLGLRMPSIPVVAFPAPAQGDDAPPRIAQAIAQAGAHGCDVLIVCRGGGSFEDLFAYNSIEVATAIRDCPVPVITGIGHETDASIADFVADHHAATPTAAATAAVPDREALRQRLADLERRMSDALTGMLNNAGQALDSCDERLERFTTSFATTVGAQLKNVEVRLNAATAAALVPIRQRLADAEGDLQHKLDMYRQWGNTVHSLEGRLAAACNSTLASRHAALGNIAMRLEALSPQRTLARGFSLVTDTDGEIVGTVAELPPDQEVVLTFADGARLAGIGAEIPRPDFLGDDDRAG